ncbi:hypothetical protein D3C75_757700 [compost metagenome]
MQRRYSLAADQLNQIIRVFFPARLRQTEHAPNHQRKEQFPDRNVKGIGGLLQNDFPFVHPVRLRHPAQTVHQSPVRQHDSFGFARRS